MTKLGKIICLCVIVAFAGAAIFLFHRAPVKVHPEISVTIPEGATVYDIDRILSGAGVIQPGQLIAAAAPDPAASDTATASGGAPLEGKLFPDTYFFYPSSSVDSVIGKMVDDFDAKAAPLFAAAGGDASNTDPAPIMERDLIIASMVQKEVPGAADQAIVAGIINKRLQAGMPLDIDATICYAKQQAAWQAARISLGPDATATPGMATSTAAGCYPVTLADLRIDSLYNTYRHKDLPPTPIGNPGVSAIEAAFDPATSTYWYYLSDPRTGKTIYAVTLEEQIVNEQKYFP
jgi:UPF0755 protein